MISAITAAWRTDVGLPPGTGAPSATCRLTRLSESNISPAGITDPAATDRGRTGSLRNALTRINRGERPRVTYAAQRNGCAHRMHGARKVRLLGRSASG
jgi:hypothetical protein